MKISGFKLTGGDFGIFGKGLRRPESVWVDADGVWASDSRGGIAHVQATDEPILLGSGIKVTNGFSRRPDGSFVAVGLADGGLHLIRPDGATVTILDNLDGMPLGTVNCAWADGSGRIWLSVMTRHPTWQHRLCSATPDGYVLRIDGDAAQAARHLCRHTIPEIGASSAGTGAPVPAVSVPKLALDTRRSMLQKGLAAACSSALPANVLRYAIAADGLDLTNEVKVSPDGRHLYLVETFGCRVVRFAIGPDGILGPKEFVGPKNLGPAAFADGFAFDPLGNIWVAVVNYNALFVIDRHGEAHVVYADKNERAVAAVADAFERGAATVDLVAACGAVDGPLRQPTSIAFGGPNGRTAYVGSLVMEHLVTFELPDNLE